MNLKYLTQDEIDTTLYNSTIHYATNGNIFGYKWFLDAVAKEWDLIIEDEYQSVLPLPFTTNAIGKKSYYQPKLMRELGVFSIHVLSPPRVKRMIEKIPLNWLSKIEINLNEQIALPEGIPFKVVEKTNAQLLLNQPYEKVKESFSDEVKKVIKGHDFTVRQVTKPEVFADFFKRNTPNFKNKDMDFYAYQRLIYQVLHRGWGRGFAVYNKENEILAVNFYIYSHSKALSLIPIESKEGKKYGALHILMNHFIETNSGKNLILDFNLSHLNDTYHKGIGAQENIYQNISFTKILP